MECVIGPIGSGKTTYIKNIIKNEECLFINHLFPASLETIKNYRGYYIVVDNIHSMNKSYQYIVSAMANKTGKYILLSCIHENQLIEYIKSKRTKTTVLS